MADSEIRAQLTAPPAPPKRPVGRPRGFSDEDVFRVTTRLLLEGGISNLTLKRVAAQLGVTHQAVGQRFDSKDGLLRAYHDWFDAVVGEDTRHIHESVHSSVELLKRLLTMPIDPRLFDADTTEAEASWTLISLELRRLPVLTDTISHGLVRYTASLAAIVRQGQARGELLPGDAETIADLALTVGIGAATKWLLSPQEPLLEAMERSIDLALSPYVARN